MTVMWTPRLDADSTKSILFPLIITSGTSNALVVLESNKHLDLEGFIESSLALAHLSIFRMAIGLNSLFDLGIRMIFDSFHSLGNEDIVNAVLNKWVEYGKSLGDKAFKNRI